VELGKLSFSRSCHDTDRRPPCVFQMMFLASENLRGD
jgi:hypothetical protein